MTHDVASLTRCTVLGNSPSVVPVLNAWMESLSQVMTDRTIAHGFGYVSETVRTTAFFSRLCSCGYDYDRGRSVVSGIPFPPIILDILRYIMPICGVHEETLWPTACNVNFYKDGFKCFCIFKLFNQPNSTSPLGWHEDNEPMHGPLNEPYAILSLSLGTTRNFDIRETLSKKFACTIPLRHGDLVSMNGKFQSVYQHRYVEYIIYMCTLYVTLPLQCSKNDRCLGAPNQPDVPIHQVPYQRKSMLWGPHKNHNICAVFSSSRANHFHQFSCHHNFAA